MCCPLAVGPMMSDIVRPYLFLFSLPVVAFLVTPLMNRRGYLGQVTKCDLDHTFVLDNLSQIVIGGLEKKVQK